MYEANEDSIGREVEVCWLLQVEGKGRRRGLNTVPWEVQANLAADHSTQQFVALILHMCQEPSQQVQSTMDVAIRKEAWYVSAIYELRRLCLRCIRSG